MTSCQFSIVGDAVDQAGHGGCALEQRACPSDDLQHTEQSHRRTGEAGEPDRPRCGGVRGTIRGDGFRAVPFICGWVVIRLLLVADSPLGR